MQINPFTSLDRPWGFQEIEAPRFQDNQHMKVVRLSALRTGRVYSPVNIPGTHFCQRLSQPQGHSAAGRIMSMKNSNDTIGNRTRDLPACSAVPQPTAPPRSPEIPQKKCEKKRGQSIPAKILAHVFFLSWQCQYLSTWAALVFDNFRY